MKEDLPPAAVVNEDDEDALEIVGFVPQRRSRLTTMTLDDPVKTEKRK